MKEFIEKEKARLQALFGPFNEGSSWMTLIEPSREPVRLGLIDSYTVTCVAPHTDTPYLFFEYSLFDHTQSFS